MSKVIDQKVVEMKFDNSNFEKNTKISMNTLDKLKEKLNLANAAKSFEDLERKANSVKFQGLANTVETIADKFSGLQMAGTLAMYKIADATANAGLKLAKSLSVDNISAGWNKLQQYSSSVSTLTSQGYKLDVVEKQMEKLNWFSDETSYNFTDMIDNIAKFTATGEKLEPSVTAMEGIALWAAKSGQNAQKASSAMYQLSQALGSGIMRREDYKSIQNVNMDTDEFRQKALDAAVALKTVRKVGKDTYKSLKGDGQTFKKAQFADSLTKGEWFTKDVMMKVYGEYAKGAEQVKELIDKMSDMDVDLVAGDVIKAYDAMKKNKFDEFLTDNDITGDAAEQLRKMVSALDDFGMSTLKAGQEYRTFNDVLDATKDAVSTKWMNIFKTILGDVDAQKELWSTIGEQFYDWFATPLDNLQTKLTTWSKSGGREALFGGLSNIADFIGSITEPIKNAFKDIFKGISGEKLADLTKKFQEFTSKLTISDEAADKIKRTFKGLFSILDIGKKSVKAVLGPIFKFLTGSSIGSIGDGILNITASIGDFFTKLNESSSVGNAFAFVAKGISSALNFMGEAISSILGKFDSFKSVLSKIGGVISKFAGLVKNVLGKVFTWIKDNISGGDVLAGLTGAGIFAVLKKLSDVFETVNKLFEKISDVFKGFGKSTGTFKEIMGSIKDTLTSFQQGIKVASLVGIAIAITLLSSSIRKLSELKVSDIAVGLIAMKLMIMELNSGFKSLCKTLKEYPAKGTLRASISLIAMAEAINILASVMQKLSGISLADTAKGLAGIGICIKALTKSMKTMSETKGVVQLRDSIALIAMATACKILASAISSIGNLSWEQLAKGLIGMGLCIAALSKSMEYMSKAKGVVQLRDSVALIAMVTACKILASAIASISNLSWEQWAKGLVGIGLCIAALSKSMEYMSKAKGVIQLRDSIALIAMATACKILASVINDISDLSWNDWAKGMLGMGLCITALTKSIKIISKSKKSINVKSILAFIGIATACKILAKAIEQIGYLSWEEWGKGMLGMGLCIAAITGSIMLISSSDKVISVKDILAFVGIATACKILANALVEIGYMSWEQIARGLVGMGVALAEMVAAVAILSKFSGGKALVGAASILIMSFTLGKIADALTKIGAMSWSEIARGLVGMGGALVELGVVCGALGYLTGFAGLVGAGTIWLAVQGLDQLAEALIKFGSMSWDEIGRGLTAMLGALSDIALGSLLNTLGTLGSMNIAIIADPLGTLADSFKKWADIDYETISTGMQAMNAAFTKVALGSLVNTLSGLGSLSIATIAAPLGTLADSVMKWKDVVVPENLGSQLAQLAGGITSFTLSGLGAGALAEAAPGLGQMADSVMKWKDVTIPEGLNEGLKSISEGVQSFSWAFMGGWSLSAITGPLGDLSDAISKWKGVVIPDSVKDGLTNIADGVKSFSWAFTAGWSLSAIIGPLGDLANTVTKWKDVVIPDTIKDGLKSIAEGINEFTLIGAVKLSSIAEPLNTLGNAFKNFSSLTGDASNLTTVADNIKSCCDKLGDINSKEKTINSASGVIDKLTSMISKVNGTDVSNVEHFVTAANKLNEIKIGEISVNTDSLQSAVNTISSTMNSIETTITNSKTSISNAMEQVLSGLETAINNSKSKSENAINSVVTAMVSKIKSLKSSITSAFKSLASEGADGIKDNQSSFVGAGKYLGDGLIKGINGKQTEAYNAGYALGQAAVQGEKDGQQSHSPSKATIKAGKWLGEGLIIGIKNMVPKVNNAGKNMGETATNGISNALDTVNKIISSDMDAQPTIRPVLDLSDVRSGVSSLGSMLNTQSIGVRTNLNAISYGMNNRVQNGTNNDVVSAIDKLRKNLSNVGGDTYNINGVSYSDDNSIADAVQVLVRAATVEGRK